MLEFNIAPSEVRAMTAGEIKTLIKYKNGESPEAPKAHYEELLQDLREAKKDERNRNTGSQDHR